MTDQDKKIEAALKENLESTEFTNLHVRNVAISFFNEGVKAALATTAPTQPEPERDERQAFEDYIRLQNPTILFIARWPDKDFTGASTGEYAGHYKHAGIDEQWTGWKARAALERK